MLNNVLTRDTTDLSILEPLMDTLSAVFPDIFWDDLALDLTARGYYTQTIYEQMRAVIRLALEMARNKPDKVFQALLDSPLDKLHGLAAEIAFQGWHGEPSKALARLKKVTLKPGPWAKSWAAVGVHRLCIAHGVEGVLDHVRSWVLDENPEIRALIINGLRPRLSLVPHIDELKRSPGWLRPVFESCVGEKDPRVLEAIALCLEDISKDNPVIILEWVEAWMLQKDSAFWQSILEKALLGLLEQGNPRALAVLGYARLDGVKARLVEPTNFELAKNLVLALRVELQAEKIEAGAKAYIHARLKPVVDAIGNEGDLGQEIVPLGTCHFEPGKLVELGSSLHFVDTPKRLKERGPYNLQILLNGWPILDQAMMYRKMKSS